VGEREGEVEGGAGAELAFSPDASAVGLNDVLDNSKSQAGTAGFARACFVDAIEALEDAIKVFEGDAGTEVLHAELDFSGQESGANANVLPFPSVLESVLNQVAEDLVHGVGVGHDERVGCAGRFKFDVGIDDDTAERIDSIFDKGTGAVGLECELVVGTFNAGESEQVFSEAVHAGGVLVNDAEEFAGSFRARIGIFDKGLDVALNGGERGAELMANVGHEFLPDALELPEPGQVMEDDDRPVV